MTEIKKKKLKKWIFPAGIFTLLFLTETIIGSAAVFTYLYIDGKKEIERIEKYTVNYSMTLAEAFARVAELSYKSKKYSSLTTLFHEKIEENTIDEAFFILSDGSLVVHSNTAIEKGLKGNIANDEMAYNIDMILQPVTKNSTELFLSDYNIISRQVPFKREVREYIQKYFYKDISSSGWLFTRGVFVKGKAIGAVNFIISKERIFNYINESFARGKKMIAAVLSSSLFISFLISLIVMFRYRAIQKKAGEYSALNISTPAISHATHPPLSAEEAFNESELYSADENLDIMLEEPLDKNFAEEAVMHFDSQINEEPLPELTGQANAGDDEYVTIELLGDIDEEEHLKPELKLDEKGRIYVAPVISIEAIRKSRVKDIKDAIPVTVRGGDVLH